MLAVLEVSYLCQRDPEAVAVHMHTISSLPPNLVCWATSRSRQLVRSGAPPSWKQLEAEPDVTTRRCEKTSYNQSNKSQWWRCFDGFCLCGDLFTNTEKIDHKHISYFELSTPQYHEYGRIRLILWFIVYLKSVSNSQNRTIFIIPSLWNDSSVRLSSSNTQLFTQVFI